MKLNLFKKVCLTVMGVGVVSSLVSVGTFATFTAATTNTSNSFTSGTLTLTNVTSSVGAAQTLVGSGTAPQTLASQNASSGTDCSSGVVANSCATVLSVSNVVASGLEPGEFVQGQLAITNSGSLPATVALQVQNLLTTVPTCGTGATCADPGPALNITINDSTSGKCLFGDASGVAAPSGSPLQVGAAACTSIITTAALGTGSSSVTRPGNSVFGACLTGCNPTAATPAGSLATFSRNATGGTPASSLIFVPGTHITTKSLTNAASPTGPGNLTGINQWAANSTSSGGLAESHTFVVTIAFPDTGYTTKTIGSDTFLYGSDNGYQGVTGTQVSFDLVFLAFQ